MGDKLATKIKQYRALPSLRAFHESGAQLRAIVGPVGSGKTSAASLEIGYYLPHHLAKVHGIKKTRWVVVRNCYDEKTEILTDKRGWVRFADLEPGDAVATLKNGKMAFEVPSYYYAAPYCGDMVRVASQGLDLLVTPEHHLWVSHRRGRKKAWHPFKHVRAVDIEGIGGVYRNAATSFPADGIPTKRSEDFFEFLGFWYAEGYASVTPRKDYNGLHYRLVVTNKDTDGYVVDLLERNGFQFGACAKVNGCYNFTISTKARKTKALIRYLARFGKSKTKFVPEWIRRAPVGHLRAFLYGFERGDGHTRKRPNDSTQLYTASPRLANDLHEMLVRSGRAATVNLDTRGTLYTITILIDARSSPLVAKGMWSRRKYDGMVYCVEVSTHVVYVRRNGRAVWCGQTYPEIRDTTLKTLREWFPDADYQKQANELHITYQDGIEAEILLRSCDRPQDVDKFKSLELTGFWVDESIEVAQEVMRMLKNRIGRYPPQSPVRFGIETTNPPDVEHPLYSMYDWGAGDGIWQNGTGLPDEVPVPTGEPLKNHAGFWQPPRENEPNLRPGYYDDLTEDYADSPDWVAMYIMGFPGIIAKGKLVYANFVRRYHVSSEPLKWTGSDLFRGWDNSGNCPACVVAQMPTAGQVQILKEFTTDKMGIVDFTAAVVVECNQAFPDARYTDYGDPAGANQFSKPGGGFTSNAQLQKEESGVEVHPSEQNPVARIQAVDQALGKINGLLIDPSCIRLINGFLGGYHYPEIGKTGEYRQTPEKNRFSHPQDGLQYLLVKLLKSQTKVSTKRRPSRRKSMAKAYRKPADAGMDAKIRRPQHVGWERYR